MDWDEGGWPYSWIAHETKGYKCAVEFGAMRGDKLMAASTPRKIAIEIFGPSYVGLPPEVEGVLGDFLHYRSLLANAAKGAYGDVALLIDSIEHVEKNAALKLIGDLQEDYKKILIMTPIGFMHQEAHGGNEHQRHLSGWEEAEFQSLGFKTGTIHQKYILATWEKNQ